LGLSIQDICTNVRLRLGDPRSQAPNDQAVLNAVCSQVRALLRFRRITGNPWNLNDVIINVVPNQDTYTINQPDFGSPLAVLSYNPSAPLWIPRLIKIYEPQNLFLDLPPLPQSIAANAYIPWDGTWSTAQRVAFYWRDNQAYVQFWPMPLMASGYQCRYLQNADGVNQASLSSSPLPSEDDDLVELRAATSLLPISDWQAPESPEGVRYNAEKRRDLATTLANDEREARALFEAQMRQPTGPRIYRRFDPSVC